MAEKKSMKSKKTAINSSRGVKKVEEIEERVEKQPSKKPAATQKTVQEKVKKEKTNAKGRVEKAKAKEAKKQQKIAMKKAQAEKKRQKLALKKAKAEKRRQKRAEKLALKKQNEQLRRELALKRRENKIHERELKKQAAEQRRRQRKEGKKHAPGYGGWLAAVITLGATSLALASVLTVGAVNMQNMNTMVTGGYKSNLYEMTELTENLGGNINKLRIATGEEEQRALLTDILIESELLESALERFPVDQATTCNISSFVNNTAAYAKEGLKRIAKEGALGMENGQSIEYMYSTNQAILQELTALRNSLTDNDWYDLMKGKEDCVAQKSLSNVNTNVITTPTTIQDGPFSENKKSIGALGLQNLPEVSKEKATALLKGYLQGYNLQSVEFKGETVADKVTCFNYTLTDKNGKEMYAQVSKAGGKLVMFNSYEECNEHNFNKKQCIETAQKFLKKIGFENMKAVWLQENGTTANVNFVYEQDGVLCYSDMVIVKVCETKGKVIGLEAMPYYLNHGERKMEQATISQETAAESLGKLQAKTARLALIPYDGEERLTYEFTGVYDGQRYFVYVDARTGEELEDFIVLNTKQGEVVR